MAEGKAQKRSQILNTVICLVVVLVEFGLILKLFTVFYSGNDDTTILAVLSGTYSGTPDARCMQLLYPLGVLFKWLYLWIPTIPWYGGFLFGCNALCAFLFAVRFAAVTGKYWKKLLFLAVGGLLILTLALYSLVFLQYTETSGFLMATAAYWFYSTDVSLKPSKYLRSNIVSIVLILVAFALRSEMALFLFPFVCLIGLFRWSDAAKAERAKEKVIDGKKRSMLACFFSADNRVKYMSIIVSVVIGLIVLMVVDSVAYSQDGFGRFRELFNDRTTMYDYMRIPSYGEESEMYDALEISSEQVELFEQYTYTLDPAIDADVFDRMEAMLDEDGNYYLSVTLGTALRDYVYRLFHKQDAPYIYFIWMGYFLVVISALMRRKYDYFWRLPVLFGLRSALWLYLILRGRMPDRVTRPLYIMEFAILVAMVLAEIRAFRSTNKIPYQRFWPTTVLTVMTMLCLGGGLKMVEQVNADQEKYSKLYEDWNGLLSYCEENRIHFYVLDTYATTVYMEPVFIERSPKIANSILAGGWMCKSPQEEEKFAAYGISDMTEAMVHRDDVFFVTYANRDLTWLKQYFAFRGYEVELNPVATLPISGYSGKDTPEAAYVIYSIDYYYFSKLR